MWIIIIIIPILTVLDLRLLKIYFKLVFDSKEDFYNSVRYNFIPEIFSLFKGEYLKDKFAEFKLGVFMFLCFITIILEVILVSKILDFI
ncbi:MAG: hypothetical protein LIR50_12555 [Bacillota bacterium]|nr:hypothetical protein [Bacillota bacterium]